METKTLKLTFVGMDSWDRPVYSSDSGTLYVDTNPREGWKANICTKCNNAFDGEPDVPVSNDYEIELIPKRVVW